MRSYVFAGAFALLGASAAQAADLIVDAAPPATVDAAYANSSIYVQLLGGVAQNLDVTYYQNGNDTGSSETEFGYAVAGTIGVVVMDGLSVEADVLHTSRDYGEADNGEFYTTTSLMGNLKYTIQLDDTFSVYGAAGLGYVWGTDEAPGYKADYNGFGYQLIAGVSASLTDNITGLVEYRYQNQFDSSDNIDDGTGYGLEIPASTVLVGLRLSF